jgi:hypothetical protein
MQIPLPFCLGAIKQNHSYDLKMDARTGGGGLFEHASLLHRGSSSITVVPALLQIVD